ncbi:MAG: aminomethyl-transferring glycine dehydrogenase subunit GcvPA [Candidatus Omnitrophota bacterium]|jgi:glycine dehydrogenase subunit 1|nr:MAG: aminomethyl-transferring glycine dehydrogenase subunit GcvPA [Candidatus Omnitrophota bacterium]
MDFIPHTTTETRDMLDAIGVNDAHDLFRMIPDSLKNAQIPFPPPLSEMEVAAFMRAAAQENTGSGMAVFAGGGAYDHFIPQAAPALIARGDFHTAYTPYQAEASQGTLQAIYEFQTLMCRLTGMEVANASMYDGASALAEAALMACRLTRKEKILVSTTINPHYRRVMRTYLEAPGIKIIEIPQNGGVVSKNDLQQELGKDIAAVFLQYPNYFGILEPIETIAEMCKTEGSLLGVSVYPLSLGLLQPPGTWSVDFVVGDLQSLGLSLQFGGPYAGFIAIREKYVRQLPGRLAGRTKDADGRTGYVLTLQTREQHIRRAKATSNICTNQALCALAASMYLSLMGPKGLRQAAERSVRNAHDLHTRLCGLNGVRSAFDRPFFNEFVIELSKPISKWLEYARKEKIIAGIHIEPGLVNEKEALLVCATEKTSPTAIDHYVKALANFLKNCRVS